MQPSATVVTSLKKTAKLILHQSIDVGYSLFRALAIEINKQYGFTYIFGAFAVIISYSMDLYASHPLSEID